MCEVIHDQALETEGIKPPCTGETRKQFPFMTIYSSPQCPPHELWSQHIEGRNPQAVVCVWVFAGRTCLPVRKVDLLPALGLSWVPKIHVIILPPSTEFGGGVFQEGIKVND